MSLRRTVAAALFAASTLTLASPGLAQNPAGAMPWVLKPGEFYSELTGSVYAARSFYDNERERPSLEGKLDERELVSYTEMGWKTKATLWFSVPFVNRGFTRFSGGTSTSTGLGDLDFGMRYRLKGGSMPASL